VANLLGLGFHLPPGRPKTFSFLSVCPSRFWTSETVCPISPWSGCSTETILIPLDRGRFVVVHRCSSFSDCRHVATPDNVEVQKNAKIGGFRRQRATELTDRDEIWHVSVYRGSALAHQIWPLSLKGLDIWNPNVKICPKLRFLSLEVDTINGFGCNLACERRRWVYCLTPNLVQIDERGLAPKPSKCENLVEIATYISGFSFLPKRAKYGVFRRQRETE